MGLFNKKKKADYQAYLDYENRDFPPLTPMQATEEKMANMTRQNDPFLNWQDASIEDNRLESQPNHFDVDSFLGDEVEVTFNNEETEADPFDTWSNIEMNQPEGSIDGEGMSLSGNRRQTRNELHPTTHADWYENKGQRARYSARLDRFLNNGIIMVGVLLILVLLIAFLL